VPASGPSKLVKHSLPGSGIVSAPRSSVGSSNVRIGGIKSPNIIKSEKPDKVVVIEKKVEKIMDSEDNYDDDFEDDQ